MLNATPTQQVAYLEPVVSGTRRMWRVAKARVLQGKGKVNENKLWIRLINEQKLSPVPIGLEDSRIPKSSKGFPHEFTLS